MMKMKWHFGFTDCTNMTFTTCAWVFDTFAVLILHFQKELKKLFHAAFKRTAFLKKVFKCF